MIEWQAEAGLFTVRIRGKQWYWIYKFEIKTFTDILTAPKNIGRDKWAIYTPGDMQVANDYLHVLQLRSQNKWIKKFWNKYLLDSGNPDNFHLVSAQEQLRYNFHKNLKQINRDISLNENKLYLNTDIDILDTDFIKSTTNTILYENGLNNYIIRAQNKKRYWEDLNDSYLSYDFLSTFKNKTGLSSDYMNVTRALQVEQIESLMSFFNKPFDSVNNIDNSIWYKYSDVPAINRWLKRSYGTPNPVRLLKLPLDDESKLVGIRFYDTDSTIKQKPTPHTTFLTMKQKRYARKKILFPRKVMYRDELGKKTDNVKFSGKTILYNNELFLEPYADTTRQYRLFRKNKKRYENTSVLLSRRMLRTRRTLVLPAHVNLTAITNSYDVIHSWFIPGLGLKMDCIPGRATHHTFYIDNVGFYYGQCAEICGRYHHHMPIRICALPFEHFLVWWHTFGLPKLMSTRTKKRYRTYYASRKYVW